MSETTAVDFLVVGAGMTGASAADFPAAGVVARHQGFFKGRKARGGRPVTDARLVGLERRPGIPGFTIPESPLSSFIGVRA